MHFFYIIMFTSLLFQSQEVTVCTASLTFSKSTFCPHSVFMCFVWIWEQTAVISLYNINWPDLRIQMVCVYCEVRTGCNSVGSCCCTVNDTTSSRCAKLLIVKRHMSLLPAPTHIAVLQLIHFFVLHFASNLHQHVRTGKLNSSYCLTPTHLHWRLWTVCVPWTSYLTVINWKREFKRTEGADRNSSFFELFFAKNKVARCVRQGSVHGYKQYFNETNCDFGIACDSQGGVCWAPLGYCHRSCEHGNTLVHAIHANNV